MSKNSNSGGISISGLLGVAFVILKLTGYITWSWWYVTMPFWLPLVIVLVAIFVFVSYRFIKQG